MEVFIAPALSALAAVLIPWFWHRIKVPLEMILRHLEKLNGSVVKLEQRDQVLSERVARIEGRLGLPPHEEPK